MTLRHGTSLDDIICQNLMELALDDTAFSDLESRSSKENPKRFQLAKLGGRRPVSYTHLRAHET